MTLVEKFEGGQIEYRLPTVPEALELMARVGMTGAKEDQDNADLKNGLLIVSKVIAHMGPMIISVKTDFGEGKIESYNELVKCSQAMAPLISVASRITEAMQGGSEIKKKR